MRKTYTCVRLQRGIELHSVFGLSCNYRLESQFHAVPELIASIAWDDFERLFLPPRMVRAVLWQYWFSSLQEQRAHRMADSLSSRMPMLSYQ
jgi:hypothetical protein